MNKRKSVSRVTERDARDANKYVLTHQTVDSEGDLETNLVKVIVCGQISWQSGDVLPVVWELLVK